MFSWKICEFFFFFGELKAHLFMLFLNLISPQCQGRVVYTHFPIYSPFSIQYTAMALCPLLYRYSEITLASHCDLQSYIGLLFCIWLWDNFLLVILYFLHVLISTSRSLWSALVSFQESSFFCLFHYVTFYISVLVISVFVCSLLKSFILVA